VDFHLLLFAGFDRRTEILDFRTRGKQELACPAGVNARSPPKAAITVSIRLNRCILTRAPVQPDPLPPDVMVASTPCTAARWRDASRGHVQ
jgi:hypothetical protein